MNLDLLDLHARLVAIPSPSHAEGAVLDFAAAWLADAGAAVRRYGANVFALAPARGGAPARRLLLTTHLDTVPPTSAWTRDPHAPTRDGDRIYGLGSNDAKASAAAMMCVLAELVAEPLDLEVGLLLVAEEETGGKGTELAWPALVAEGWHPLGVVVGEPTGLELAVAQKGLVVLELKARGQACHAAHARALGAVNPLVVLARDLVALEGLTLGEPHALLGESTLAPTVAHAGQARNQIPGEATAILDLRTVPGTAHDVLVERVRARVTSDLRAISTRLVPVECPADALVLAACRQARPRAKVVGSRTMSDLVFFRDVPALKCGPGLSLRSHTPDEFVLASEVSAGRDFYRDLVVATAALAARAPGGSA